MMAIYTLFVFCSKCGSSRVMQTAMFKVSGSMICLVFLASPATGCSKKAAGTDPGAPLKPPSGSEDTAREGDTQDATASDTAESFDTAELEQREAITGAPELGGMLRVPGGAFEMGLDSKRGIPDERPAHNVTVETFDLDETEVTNEAYSLCVETGVCRKPAGLETEKAGFAPLEVFRRPDHPVVGISHSDAQTYCRFVGKRLPTEAEWERAARGDDARLYPWGDEAPTTKVAVFRAKSTAPVGSRPMGRGPYGHLDLAGNVWEWVADTYDPYAYRRATAARGIPADCDEVLKTLAQLRREKKQGFTGTNPIPRVCEHVLRGGAFNYFPWGLRSSNRVHHPGSFRMAMAGFRCAKDAVARPK